MHACQWLDNVDIHAYAKFDQNIPCGSRVMSIFPNCYPMNGLINGEHLRVVQFTFSI